MLSTTAAVWLSIAIGVCLELGVHFATGRREAWDSALFWTVGLPAAAIASLAIGYFSRGKAWRSTIVVAPSQVLVMMIRGGEPGNLWPLTLVLSAVLSAPFVIAAFIGSRFRRSVPSEPHPPNSP